MGSPRTTSLIVVALALVPVSAAAQQHLGAKTIYCCEDDRGVTACSDILPQICYGRAYREITPQGTVRRHVSAPPSREEMARRDAEAEQRRLREVERLRQRRLDEALMQTYTSLEEVDVREERALADVEKTVREVRAKEIELIDQRARLRSEAEFYKDRELPRELSVSLRSVEAELAAYRSVLEAKEGEREAIKARYATDRRRYAELIAEGQVRR